MISLQARGLLLDIEGTISSIQFVHEVLFPYARQRLAVFLRTSWNDPVMPALREEIARHFGAPSFESWTGGAGMPPEHRLRQLHQALLELMDQDAKWSFLKTIQGMIWQHGYHDGALRSQLYPDAIAAFKRWRKKGLDLRIYSSGSVAAQQLFFAHVDNGSPDGWDLSELFSGYYDTQTGPKRDPESYRKIAQAYSWPPADILFLSDVPEELDAARSAGMQTLWVRRADHPHLSAHANHPSVSSLDQLKIVPMT
jgi:enolase-phosphatase E1